MMDRTDAGLWVNGTGRARGVGELIQEGGREGGTVDREGEREVFLKGTTIQSQVKVGD
jgi:hypothetical protein